MKRKARVLKRVRAQIEHNNKITRLAEEALSPPPQWSSKIAFDQLFNGMASNLPGIGFFVDTETSALRGRPVHNTILNDNLELYWESLWHVYGVVSPVKPVEVPAARARDGSYGVTGLAIPGMREMIVKEFSKWDIRDALLGSVHDFTISTFVPIR